MDRRGPDFPVLAVDPAHRLLDLVAQLAVSLYPLPARAGDLDQDRLRPEAVLVEQLAEGSQPVQYPLGVVEPVDAHQHHLRLAQGLPDVLRSLLDVLPPRDLAEAGRVDRDRERRRLHLPRAVRAVHPHGRSLGGQARGPAARAQEVRRVGPALEPDQVRAEQALDHLPAPRKLGEDLVTGERDVVKKADPQVAAQLAEHPRHQLELVVMDPYRRPVAGLLRRGLGEALVDRHVGFPPAAVELGRCDDVVIQRPQRRVGEPLVEPPDLGLRKSNPDQLQALGLERARGRARVA